MNKTLSGSLAAKLFNDLQAAQPLGSLPRATGIDTTLEISWDGQQTPNIVDGQSSSSGGEQNLFNDYSQIASDLP